MSNSSTQYDELMLWNDLRNGDEEALAQLLRLYAKSLISYGRKMVTDDALIEDCIQEVFIQLWQYRQNLKVEVGSVKAYLFAAVRRRIISEIKKNETISLYEHSNSESYFDIDFSIEEKIVKDETELQRVRLINERLNHLPKRQKEVVYLKFYKELSNQEIAKTMGVKYQSVSNLIHEALTLLRTLFPDDAIWFGLIVWFLGW